MPDTPDPQRHRITFDDHAEVTATHVVPVEPLGATVVCLPALGVQASYYEPLALALAALGIGVVTADLRGLGLSSVRPRRGVDFGYARLVADAATVVRHVRQHAAGPLYLLGHSLGGHVGGLLAGTTPDDIDGLALVACGTPYWRVFPRNTGAKIRMFAHLARTLSVVLGYYPGHRVGFSGIEAAQLMREWSGLARRGQLRAAGIDAEATWAAVRAPVLAVSIERDWLAPPAAVDALVAKMPGAPVARMHLAGDDVDVRAFDHFRWARYPDAVAALIARWMSSRHAR